MAAIFFSGSGSFPILYSTSGGSEISFNRFGYASSHKKSKEIPFFFLLSLCPFQIFGRVPVFQKRRFFLPQQLLQTFRRKLSDFGNVSCLFQKLSNADSADPFHPAKGKCQSALLLHLTFTILLFFYSMLPSARGVSLPQHILISEKERLSQMLYTNPVFSFQICNRPRHTDNAVASPHGKPRLLAGLFQKLLLLKSQRTVF